MKTFDENNNRFHGGTYNEIRDYDRLGGALKRIYDFLWSNEGKWISAPTLCHWADVSSNSYRNRLSDLRVYHGCIIESENIKEGLWKYKYAGQMSREEHEEYLLKLELKRTKVPGDKEKFSQVLRFIYAFAHDEDLATKEKAKVAVDDWLMDFTNKLRESK